MANDLKPAKPFIWLGPGVLWLDTSPTNRIVVHPRGIDEATGKEFTGIVRKAENLKHIGHDRLEEFVNATPPKAKYINIVDQVIDGVKGLEDSAEQQTAEDKVVTDSVLDGATVKANADTVQKAKVDKAIADIAAQPKTEKTDPPAKDQKTEPEAGKTEPGTTAAGPK